MWPFSTWAWRVLLFVEHSEELFTVQKWPNRSRCHFGMASDFHSFVDWRNLLLVFDGVSDPVREQERFVMCQVQFYCKVSYCANVNVWWCCTPWPNDLFVVWMANDSVNDSRVTIIFVEWCTVHFTRKIGLELGDIIWKHASPTETSWCSFLPSVCWSPTEKMFCICIIWVLTQSTMMWLKCSFFF